VVSTGAFANRALVDSKFFRLALRRMARLLETDAEVRDAMASPEDLAFLRGKQSSIELVAAACERYASKVCLGMRAPHAGDAHGEEASEPGLGDFKTLTYGSLWARVAAIAGGLSELGLASKGQLTGICGFGSVDWVLADLACAYVGAISVPLPGGLGAAELEHILHETDLRVVFSSVEALPALVGRLERHASLRSIVVMDDTGADPNLGALRARHEVYTIDEVAAAGRSGSPIPFVLPEPGGDPLFSVVYTSGSTGMPKGVIVSAGRWAATLREAIERKPIPVITVGYLPLSHMAGRINLYTTMMLGGRTLMRAGRNMSTLFEDVRRARPTNMTLVPRVSEMICQHFQSEYLLRTGRHLAMGPMLEDAEAESILSEMRGRFLGDRLCFLATGAAPTAPEVVAFLERCFHTSITDAYGSTEFGRVAVNGRVEPWISYKLVDAPELGYSIHDKPFPRGELAVKSPRETPGYFRNAEASDRLRDAEGYILSGDIVEERAPGHVVWIDRRNSALRLAHGEFVNVSRLEGLYPAESPFIDQIYVYGNSLRAYVLAVVVPNMGAVRVELGEGESTEAALKRLLRRELDRVALGARLAPHEVPRDFVIERLPFTSQDDLVTETNKARRPQLRAQYGPRLEVLYESIEARKLGELGAMDAPATLEERVVSAVALSLGISPTEIDPARNSFPGLGGDSFNAVRLCSLLKDHCGASIPVAAVLDVTATVGALALRVQGSLAAPPRRLTFDDLHGRDAERIRARDLRVDRVVPPALVENAGRLPSAGAPTTIVLTGASGFLGRFLLLELLERVAPRDGRVVCIVRAKDDAAALARVRAGFARAGEALATRFDALAAGRLAVHAGDFMVDRLGLDDRTYDELCSRADAVLHAGALVNHALTYEGLFEPNVAGTAEILRLALTARRKVVSFVSTTGIAAGLRRTASVLESESAALLWPTRPIRLGGFDYALGYTTSKWVAEVLLADLHSRCGVPVNVFRCGMVLAHPDWVGQINENDAFTRLLYGLVRTRAAPTSFYEDGYRSDRHYDGLPVNIVAEVIAASALEQTTGFRTLHVTNANWNDGVSVDTFLDWIEAAGYPLLRLPYERWFPLFRERLQALGDGEKRRSPLSIIDRWQRPIDARQGAVRLDTSVFLSKRFELTGEPTVPSLNRHFLAHCLRSIDALDGLTGDPRR
jgi:fatty acid CoA ligase FadD9